jgi:glycosyltransferase involved in cell wall biosynthesis
MILKVLHCPTTVGGHSQGLSKAERELGLDSRSVAFKQNYYNYAVDRVIFKNRSFIWNEFARWFFIIRALKKYDVIHYNFGTPLSPCRVSEETGKRPKWLKKLFNLLYAAPFEAIDIKGSHLLNKVIAVTYQGDDARQGDYCRKHYPVHFVHEVEPDYYTPQTDELKRQRISTFEKYADLIYALNPDLLNALPKRTQFLPYASVDPKLWTPHFINNTPDNPHLVHAPSHRLVKGTRFLLEAVERLTSEGIKFHFTLVAGLSNAEAKRIYESADILVDQLLAGWYGGLAVELMALGKPVICYLRESDMHYLPSGMYEETPIIKAAPDSIYTVLKEWLTVRKSELRERGIQSRAYVEKWHDPIKIAAKVKSDYEDALRRKKMRF